MGPGAACIAVAGPSRGLKAYGEQSPDYRVHLNFKKPVEYWKTLKSSGVFLMEKARKREDLIAMLAPLRVLLDAEKCGAWLYAQIHDGAVPGCPGCGRVPQGKVARSLVGGSRVSCSACKKGFTRWSRTFFEAAKISPAEFVLIRVALVAGLDHAGIMALTGRSNQTITTWTRKIQQFNQA